MELKNFLQFIEDKDIQNNPNWFFHATRNDIDVIKMILNDGIKCSHLLGRIGNHFNGKYYISLYKYDNNPDLSNFLIDSPKIIIDGISPYYADRKKFKIRKYFINTRLPLRTSEWDGEYQQYMRIDPSHFVGLEYSLSYLLSNQEYISDKQITFLKELVLYLEMQGINLPVFDLYSNKEINKEKVLYLK